MPLSTKRTSRLRVATALMFAFVFAGFLLGEAHYWLSPPYMRQESGSAFPLAAVVFGVLLGWPFVLGAACAWAMLDHVGLHHAWTSAVVGILTGLTVAAFAFRDGLFQTYPIAYPLCATIGLLTGLGVWWIAYGRQSRLPASPRPPLPRLVL